MVDFSLFNIQIAYLHTCFKLMFLEHGDQIKLATQIKSQQYIVQQN